MTLLFNCDKMFLATKTNHKRERSVIYDNNIN